MKTSSSMTALRLVFLTVGGVLLTYLLYRTGIGTILSYIRNIGWSFLPILVLAFMWFSLYTIAWQQFLQRMSSVIPFWQLFRIKLSGEAVNVLTPLGFVGGDPLRIYLLKRFYPVTEGAASVVVDRTLHIMATLLVVIAGIMASFLRVKHLPDNIQYGVPIALTVAIAFIAFIFIHQRKGLFSVILSAAVKLGFKREFSEETIARFEELDGHIVDFYQSRRRHFWTAFGCHTLGRLLGVLEIYIAGKAVEDSFTLFAALILCALAPMVNLIFAFVPGALGVLEGTYGGVLYLLGFDPAIGIAVQIAKRLRAVVWISIGLLFLGTADRKNALRENLLDEV